MRTQFDVQERIYRVWSSRKEEQIAVRVRYSVGETRGCRMFAMLGREEWV